jgi:ABC-type antimicrobial peptide transport system ATPase subunit
MARAQPATSRVILRETERCEFVVGHDRSVLIARAVEMKPRQMIAASPLNAVTHGPEPHNVAAVVSRFFQNDD